MLKNDSFIPITFDKSHIVTLGRRMYKESINLIRELVNNSYDADSTEIHVEITPNTISVSDNGLGMNLDELHEYFKIGSTHKKISGRSKKFGRKLIGEIGIGKFSSLGATTRFELITKKGNFKAKLVFDQNEWEKSGSSWNIPFQVLTPHENESDGTKITLFDVEQHFTPQEVADRLRTSVPISAKNFNVYINDKKVSPISIQGKSYKVGIQTDYGLISGEILLSNKALPFSELGLVCCVKDVMITRSLFGYEDYGHGARRITGKVNADFLSFTSDRNDFLINTNEYKEFHRVMREEVRKIINIIKSEEDEKLILQSRRALSKATQIVRKAFSKVPEYVSELKVEVSKSHTESPESEKEVTGSTWREKREKTKSQTPKSPGKKRGHYSIAHINPITESKVIKKIRTDLGFKFGFVNEGENGPPSYYYDNTIFVNRQHSLYQKYSKNLAEETNHLVRILIAEAIMLTSPADLRQYYERQMKVLTYANE